MSGPARLFRASRLVVATHNADKLREIADHLAPFAIEALSAATLGLPEPDETGDSFAANARLKATAAAAGAGLAALADDSGLSVDALGGAPGIHSARWAGPSRDFGQAMQRLWRELEAAGTANRAAHFVSVVTLAWPDGHCESFEGRVDGTLVWPPRGNGGFGYDPMFQPDGSGTTYGEMDRAEKYTTSHRARALRRLIDACLRT